MSVQTALSIVGPTATGKTDVALALAEQCIDRGLFSKVALVSADSRQVYRDIPIISGADVPKQFEQTANGAFCSQNKRISLHGVAFLEASDDWSLAHFQQLAWQVMEQLTEQDLVIFVGGTGLYHEHIFNAELPEQPGQDEVLRQEFNMTSVEELQKAVQTMAADKWQTMNHSDQHNPRRLIRVLEQTQSQDNAKSSSSLSYPEPTWYQTSLLTADKSWLRERIAKRVNLRLEQGAIEEVKRLIDRVPEPEKRATRPLFSATGVKELIEYLEGITSKATMKENWLQREMRYVKSQFTWWRGHEVDQTFRVDQWSVSAISKDLFEQLNSMARQAVN